MTEKYLRPWLQQKISHIQFFPFQWNSLNLNVYSDILKDSKKRLQIINVQPLSFLNSSQIWHPSDPKPDFELILSDGQHYLPCCLTANALAHYKKSDHGYRPLSSFHYAIISLEQYKCHIYKTSKDKIHVAFMIHQFSIWGGEDGSIPISGQYIVEDNQVCCQLYHVWSKKSWPALEDGIDLLIEPGYEFANID